ncbi:MAG: hypothetical protein EBU33_05400 [Sphingobacteriia bacterium]|nr:hypothetical protein [Sphingobacteriia bacterium]
MLPFLKKKTLKWPRRASKARAKSIHASFSTCVHFRNIAQKKIASQFNEMISALVIFDKHWETMGSKNQETIWQYLTVLCHIAEKAHTQY